jgi:hypothetical protein
LTKKDLQAIGASVIPEMPKKQRVGGGAGSLLRTGLEHNFPEIREFTGKNADLEPVKSCPWCDSYGDSVIYPGIGMLT